jgi:chromosome segregation ATPase
MSVLSGKVFGNGHLPEEVQGELRTILLQMRNERNAFERVAGEAQSSMDQASGPLSAMAESIGTLEERLRVVEQLAARAAGLEAQQRDVSSRIDQTAQQAEGIEAALDPIRSDLEQTRHLLQNTTALRADLEPLLDMGRQLQTIRVDVDTLRAELSDAQQAMASVHQQQEAAEQRGATVTAQLDSLNGKYGEMTVGLQSAEERVAQLQRAMESVGTLADQVPDLRRELHTLRALRDYVAQKVSDLEQQRETVDYATNQGTRLAELVQRIDRDLETQQETAKSFVRLEEDATRLSAVHDELSQQLDGLAERQREEAQADEMRRQEFQDLQQSMEGRIRDAIGRFEFEQERLEAASTQIADVRQAIAETEHRFDAMQETQQSVAALRTDLGQLSDRVATLAMDLAPLDSYAGQMAAAKSDIAQAEQSMKEISQRTDELNREITDADDQLTELQDLSERTEQQTRDLTALRGYLGQFEQRVAQLEAAESTVARAIDDATRRQATVDALRGDFQRMLEVAKETTDAVRVIAESHDEINDSRQLVDDVLTEIRTVKDESTRLESRRQDLTDIEQQMAMETAGSLRFQSKQAEALIGTLRDAQQRFGPGPDNE